MDQAQKNALPVDLRVKLVRSLNADPMRVLAALTYWLTMATRSDYVEAGNDPGQASDRLRASNEMIMVIAKQLRHILGEANLGYPSETMVDVLFETPGASQENLGWALRRTLESSELSG